MGGATEIFVGLPGGGQAALQFAQIAAERRQQRMVDQAMGGVLAARDGALIAGE